MSLFSTGEAKPPRDAGTVVVLREGSSGPEVLMVKRTRGAAFMADAYVFPGGRLDEADGGDCARAAARELAEEAGVQMDSSALIYFARWVTPATEPRRFDARFYLARLPDGATTQLDATGEVVELRWATPRALLAHQEAGQIKLPPPTLWHLHDLARHSTVAAALAWANSLTVKTVRPKLIGVEGVPTIVLPWDPEYPSLPGEGEVLTWVDPSATRYRLIDGTWEASRPAP